LLPLLLLLLFPTALLLRGLCGDSTLLDIITDDPPDEDGV